MADQASQDNALLSAADRATLARKLDSHIAFENSAKTDDADKIAPGGAANRADFIKHYISQLEKTWTANPGKGTFKSTVLKADGTFPEKFLKQMEKTMGAEFKAYQTERDAQAIMAGLAAQADYAQYVDPSVVASQEEAPKEAAANKAPDNEKAVDQQNTKMLREHLTTVLREMNEATPDREIPDAEMNQLVMMYINKRRETLAKAANEKINVKSDASALAADGTLDPAVKADFVQQVPELRDQYAKSIAPIAPKDKNEKEAVTAEVSPAIPGSGKFLGKPSDDAMAKIRKGTWSNFESLNLDTMRVVLMLRGGFENQPAVLDALNAHAGSKEPRQTLENWINESEESPENQKENFAIFSKKSSLFQSDMDAAKEEKNKSPVGFNGVRIKKGKLIFRDSTGVEYVDHGNKITMKGMTGRFTAANALNLATLAVVGRLPKPNADGTPHRMPITIGARGMTPMFTNKVRDMTLLATLQSCYENGGKEGLLIPDIQMKSAFGQVTGYAKLDINDLNKKARNEMLARGIDAGKLIEWYNNRNNAEADIEVGPVTKVTEANAGAPEASQPSATQAKTAPTVDPKTPSPIIFKRGIDMHSQDPAHFKVGDTVDTQSGKPATTPTPTPRTPGRQANTGGNPKPM